MDDLVLSKQQRCNINASTVTLVQVARAGIAVAQGMGLPDMAERIQEIQVNALKGALYHLGDPTLPSSAFAHCDLDRATERICELLEKAGKAMAGAPRLQAVSSS